MQIKSVNPSSLSKLESFLNETCHIPFKFFVCKESKQLKWRDLMGPEKLVLFMEIDLPALFPQLPNVCTTKALRKGFMDLHQMLQCNNISPTEADHLGEAAKKWITDFTTLY